MRFSTHHPEKLGQKFVDEPELWKKNEDMVRNVLVESGIELRRHEVRAVLDTGTDNMKGKIADAEKAKVHTMLIIGNRDLEVGNVSVRLHGKGNVGAKSRNEAIAEILESIRERRG